MVAETVDGGSIPGYGHLLPEECPDEIVRRVLSMVAKSSRRSYAEKTSSSVGIALLRAAERQRRSPFP